MTDNRGWHLVLAAIPIAAACLWLGSGRETFTKRHKNVEVEVQDELFGDTITEVVARPGPICGYYVGADLVAGSAALSALLSLAAWRLRVVQRRRLAGRS